MTFFTVRDIQEACERAGSHWFDKDTMRFFRTRICGEGRVYGGRYFVTSERSWTGPRLYSVRQASEEGSISTVGEFQGYKTAKAAISAAKRLAAS